LNPSNTPSNTVSWITMLSVMLLCTMALIACSHTLVGCKLVKWWAADSITVQYFKACVCVLGLCAMCGACSETLLP
jgi:hypothetical protein